LATSESAKAISYPAQNNKFQSLLGKPDQEAQKMGYKTGLLELKAPQAGVVKDVVTTSKSAVVFAQPGTEGVE